MAITVNFTGVYRVQPINEFRGLLNCDTISRMNVVLILAVLAASALAADQKDDEKKAADQKPTAAALSTETAAVIRQTVAKVTALGEAGRICVTSLSSDQSQARDIQSKIQELDTRMANLKQDMYRLYQTKAQRSQLDNNTEYNKLDNQGKAAQALRNSLANELQKVNGDASNQQSCIDKVKESITGIINNPSQAIPTPPKK